MQDLLGKNSFLRDFNFSLSGPHWAWQLGNFVKLKVGKPTPPSPQKKLKKKKHYHKKIQQQKNLIFGRFGIRATIRIWLKESVLSFAGFFKIKFSFS